MIENELYHTVLILSGFAGLAMAAMLLHGNLAYSDHHIYRRSRRLIALCFAVFAIGFFMHANFLWRYTCPVAASALSVSFFHIGSVLIGWSYISLLNSHYLTKKVIVRDLGILLIGVTTYWVVALNASQFMPFTPYLSSIIFIAHAQYITETFNQSYYRVKQQMQDQSMDVSSQKMGWMQLSIYVLFTIGTGSIVLTACLPAAVWPYPLLLCAGLLVFIYIIFSMNVFGSVIKSGANIPEDVTDIDINDITVLGLN